MENIFLNHTNHPAENWSEVEIAAAKKIGKVLDFPFPSINPGWNEEQVMELACENGEKIIKMNPAAVLCQGEFTYCFALATYLKAHGITVLAACSKREVKERSAGGKSIKEAVFTFVRFRSY